MRGRRITLPVEVHSPPTVASVFRSTAGMSISDQRRKRKRIVKLSDWSLLAHLFSVRSLLLCFSFLSFLCFISTTIPLSSSGFHPVLVVSSLSLLSSWSSRTVESDHDFGGVFVPLVIDNRVVFPDHVLLLVSGRREDLILEKSPGGGLECLYYAKTVNTRDKRNAHFTVQKPLYIDEYDEFGSAVRCPLPSVNDSAVVKLRWAAQKTGISKENGNGAVHSWDSVVYSATLDGSSVVVFVKGLNLRPDRVSDPTSLTCHFEWENSERNEKYMLSTKALTAAQEVVRCSLPESRHGSYEGVRVSVGVEHSFHHPRSDNHVVLPSVARISRLKRRRRRNERRYVLCVCTMVWNQASAIREWVMYHAWLGVERWFIYDNNSDDGTDEVISELDLENYNISRHVWPWIKTQEAGFSHCALRAKDECRWISFMDVDEYFFFPRSSPYTGRNSLRALFSKFSSSSRSIAEIRTACHSFGPSELSSLPARGVTVGYTCRLLGPERHKSIVRPDALDPTLLNVVHHFHIKKGYRYLNLPENIALINHYKYQVWQVFRSKFHRRVATYVADWQENQNEGSRDRAPGLGTEAIEPLDWPYRFCEVWDTRLRDFVLSNLTDHSTGLLPWEMQSFLTGQVEKL